MAAPSTAISKLTGSTRKTGFACTLFRNSATPAFNARRSESTSRAISKHVMALTASGSPRRTAASTTCNCVRESLRDSKSHRIRMWVSSSSRGGKIPPHYFFRDLCATASHRSDVSKFTMSPTTCPFRAQLSRGDFSAAPFTGPITATGRPRRVMVMDSRELSISLRQARHLALNSDAPRTRAFTIIIVTSTWSSDQVGGPGRLAGAGDAMAPPCLCKL